MAWLVWLMRAYTQPPSLAETRAAERIKIKAEFDAANAPLLNGYDWADKAKGFVRDAGRAGQGTDFAGMAESRRGTVESASARREGICARRRGQESL